MESVTNIYTTLAPSNDDLRLLLLYGGIQGDSVQCELCTVSLRDNPRHGALSYVWSEGRKVGEFSVNGFVMNVTANLKSALCSLALRSAKSSHSM
jgi:hypothetical protein